MKITMISDLHGHYPYLPGGDLLIVAGDLTARDLESEVALFDYWLHEQKYAAKIVIAGNHDNVLHQKRLKLQFGTYLEDSGCSFNGFKIWGSPWTKTFPGMNPHCKAFTCDTEEELEEKFSLIPDDTDILISHGPPYGLLDKTTKKKFVGSRSLFSLINKLKSPKLIVWGHIHEAYGHQWSKSGCQLINCSHVDENYEPVNEPMTIGI